MTATTPMVLLLATAVIVAVAMVLVATGRMGGGTALPRRPRRARRSIGSEDLR